MRLGQPQRIIAGVEELDFRPSISAARWASSRRPALTFSIVAPASFQANWLSPRSPNDRHAILMR